MFIKFFMSFFAEVENPIKYNVQMQKYFKFDLETGENLIQFWSREGMEMWIQCHSWWFKKLFFYKIVRFTKLLENLKIICHSKKCLSKFQEKEHIYIFFTIFSEISNFFVKIKLLKCNLLLVFSSITCDKFMQMNTWKTR